jgi:hypothetical protein
MLVVGCLLVDFLNLWCLIVAEAVGGFHRLVVGILEVWDLHLWQRWWLWVVVGLFVRLHERRLLPLFLLVKDLNGVLELRESSSFSVDVLPSGFSMLSCYLTSCDSFLFLTKSFNLMLNSG